MSDKHTKNENGVLSEDYKANSVGNLDDVLSKFGIYKPYQLQAVSLLGIIFLINGMHCINYIFVAEDLPYRCKVEACESEDVNNWYNYTTPQEYRSCHKYSTNSTECSPEAFNTEVVEACSEWVYDINNSFVSEFQLACQDWKRTFVGTVHSFGLMLGLLIQGQLSDKIGRKAAIIIAGGAAAIFGLTKSIANSYWIYIILEFLEATFGDNCSPAFIMSVELVDSDHRLQAQIILCILYAIGGTILSVAAWYIQYWRYYVQVIYAPSLLILLYYFFIDESVRWLLSKGRKEEATMILLKIARRNNKDLDTTELDNLKCEEDVTGDKSPLTLTFRSKVVVKRFCVCLVWWISCTFVSFGLLINSVSLAGHKYINFAIMQFMDVPVSFLMVFVLKRFNRKKPLMASFILAGLLCFLQTLVPPVYSWLSVGLYLAGKLLITFTFGTVYLYTSELFPTYTRNFMHALCSSIGRIGSVLAPMTPLLMQYNANLPTLLIAAISLSAGVLTLLVPDLANEALPDNMQYNANLPTLLIAAISLSAGVLTLLVPDLANEALPDNVRQAECMGIACHVVSAGDNAKRPSLNTTVSL